MIISIACTSLLALVSAAVVAGQFADTYDNDYFWPPEDSSWTSTSVGSLGPVTTVVAHLAQVNATVPYCSGTHDVLALTFAKPIQHDVKPSQFTVRVCPVRKTPAEDASSYVVGCPAGFELDPYVAVECAVMQPADEPNERRTVLLMGTFTETDGERITSAPQGFVLNALSVEADGSVLQDIRIYEGSEYEDHLLAGDDHGWCGST